LDGGKGFFVVVRKYTNDDKSICGGCMLKRAAVFLDRDGVIIEEDEFLVDYSKARFIERSIDAIRNIPETFLRIIVSNQSGIARGIFTYEQVEDFNSKLKAI
jgi:histidinol phosphatase-like enzyme